MKKLTIIVAMFAIASFAKSEEMNVAPEGFTALFNGKDFTNWEGRASGKEWDLGLKPMPLWTIQDGYMKRHAKGKSGRGIPHHLASTKKLINFKLLLDWRIHTDIKGAAILGEEIICKINSIYLK